VLRQVRTFDAYQITDERYWRHPVSNTFHGRDIFGPIAAQLVSGLPPWRVGPAAEDLNELAWPRVSYGNEEIEGHVQHIDRFGNIISDIAVSDFQIFKAKHASVGQLERVPWGQTYGQVEPGNPVALVGSHGFVEIGLALGNATQRACARVGMPFAVYLR